MCAAAADLQHPLKEFTVESRNEASVLREIGRTGLQIVRWFQDPVL